MTNKEAIEILTNVKNTPQITWTNGTDIAFDLAIKAVRIVEVIEDGFKRDNNLMMDIDDWKEVKEAVENSKEANDE